MRHQLVEGIIPMESEASPPARRVAVKVTDGHGACKLSGSFQEETTRRQRQRRASERAQRAGCRALHGRCRCVRLPLSLPAPLSLHSSPSLPPSLPPSPSCSSPPPHPLSPSPSPPPSLCVPYAGVGKRAAPTVGRRLLLQRCGARVTCDCAGDIASLEVTRVAHWQLWTGALTRCEQREGGGRRAGS